MNIKDVINYYGGKAPASRALAVTYGAVALWQRDDEVPELRQFQIERITGGALKVDAKILNKYRRLHKNELA